MLKVPWYLYSVQFFKTFVLDASEKMHFTFSLPQTPAFCMCDTWDYYEAVLFLDQLSQPDLPDFTWTNAGTHLPTSQQLLDLTKIQIWHKSTC